MAQIVKNLPAMQETQVWSLSCDNPLEKGMATHSSILAWRIPWIEEAGGLQSMGSQKVTHNWATNTLGQLTELKTVFYILLSGYYKGYNSETAQWRRCRGQGRGWSFHPFLNILPPAPWCVCSPTLKLSESHCWGVFMEFHYIRHDWLIIGHGWLNAISI